jgi:hypothetical protein
VNNSIPIQNSNGGVGDNKRESQTAEKNPIPDESGGISKPTQTNTTSENRDGDAASHQPYFHRLSVVGEILVGVGLIILGVMQFTVVSRQARIMKNQIGIYIRQSDIMNSQANLAGDANNLTRAIQRAFITVSELRREPIVDQAGTSWRYTPAIENSGNTPTDTFSMVAVTPFNQFVVRSTEQLIAMRRNESSGVSRNEDEQLIEWNIGAPPDPDRIFDWPPDQGAQKRTFLITQVVGPKATIYPFTASAEIGVKNAVDAMSGKLGRFFYGSVHYTDIFGDAHITKYCFRIDGIFMRKLGEGEPTVSPCQHWNCTDQACNKDKAAYEEARAATPKNEEEDLKRRRDEMMKWLPGVRKSAPQQPNP